eukprot:jgi/Bigna1/78718/fgenesh1_pg.56_\
MPRILKTTTWGSQARLPELERPRSPGPVYVPNLKFVRRNSLIPEFKRTKRFEATKTNSGRKLPAEYFYPGGRRLAPINKKRMKQQMTRRLPDFRTDGKLDIRTNVAYKPESEDFVWQWNETGRSDWCNSSSSNCMSKYKVYLKPSKRERGTNDLAPYNPSHSLTKKSPTQGGKFSRSPRWDDRAERRMKLARRLAKALKIDEEDMQRHNLSLSLSSI